MEEIFRQAQRRRNIKESMLTWENTNVAKYGIPASQNRRNIWPPFSRSAESGAVEDVESLAHGIDPIAEMARDDTALVGEQPPGCDHTQNPLYEEMKRLTANRAVLYHRLHNGETIRVLELHAGQSGQPLRCDLHYVNLQYPHLTYDALSYVWGQPAYSYDINTGKSSEITYTIVCNDRERDITPNLFAALHYIRSYTGSKFLFVDAICINQDDGQERAHQVSLMGLVYRNARKVVLWVGERMRESVSDAIWDNDQCRFVSPPAHFEAVRAQRSFGAICDIVNRWQGRTESGPTASYLVDDFTYSGHRDYFATFEEYPSMAKTCKDQGLMSGALRAHYIGGKVWNNPRRRERDCTAQEGESYDAGLDTRPDAATYSQFWLSIADLFERPWFWRVWVVQEAILAKEAVARWANVEIDWRLIGNAAAVLRTNYRDVCEKLRIGGIYNAYLMYRMSPICGMPIPSLSFIDLVRLTRQLEVTDSRDRIYGLLGIQLRDNNPTTKSLFIDPDYAITQAELWQRLAWKAIKMAENLSILSSVQYTTRDFECEDVLGIRSRLDYLRTKEEGVPMPTWAPVWSKVYRTTLAPWDVDDKFSAARGFPLQFEGALDTTPNVLKVYGIEIGAIGYEGIYMWQDVDTSLLLSEHIGSLLASRSGLLLLSRTFTAGRNSYGALTDCSEDALCDFAAYILRLHENFLASLEGIEPHLRPSKLKQYADYDRKQLRFWSGVRYREKKNFQRIFDMHPGLEKQLRELATRGDADRFCETAASICERRRLFFTMNGFVGIGPDTLRGGDILAVLSGGDVPFVLRPWRDAWITRNERGTNFADPLPGLDHKYLLVGECYVEGLMKGEAVKAINGSEQLLGPIHTELIIRQILSEAIGTEVISSTTETDSTEQLGYTERHAGERETAEYEELVALTRNSSTKHIFHIL